MRSRSHFQEGPGQKSATHNNLVTRKQNQIKTSLLMTQTWFPKLEKTGVGSRTEPLRQPNQFKNRSHFGGNALKEQQEQIVQHNIVEV